LEFTEGFQKDPSLTMTDSGLINEEYFRKSTLIKLQVLPPTVKLQCFS